jgi:hypothetical protein
MITQFQYLLIAALSALIVLVAAERYLPSIASGCVTNDFGVTDCGGLR